MKFKPQTFLLIRNCVSAQVLIFLVQWRFLSTLQTLTTSNYKLQTSNLKLSSSFIRKALPEIIRDVIDHIIGRAVIIGASLVAIVPERLVIAYNIAGSIDVIGFTLNIGKGKSRSDL